MLIKSDVVILNVKLADTTVWTEVPLIAWAVTFRLQCQSANDIKVATTKGGPYWTVKSGTSLLIENFRGLPSLWLDHGVSGAGNGPTVELIIEK